MAKLRAIPVKRKTQARTQATAEGYVRRPSQITKKKPSKRLTVRRIKNLQAPVGLFPNPAARAGDYEGARELFLFGVNDGDLYERRTTFIIDNLAKKMAKGIYDPAKAPLIWKYWADDAAKRYAKDYGGNFSVATRKMAAEMAADYYAEHVNQESMKFQRFAPKVKKNPVSRQTLSGLKNFIVQESALSSGTAFKTVGVFAKVDDAFEYAKARDAKNQAEKKRRWIKVLEG